jgi:hypothetical protein
MKNKYMKTKLTKQLNIKKYKFLLQLFKIYELN